MTAREFLLSPMFYLTHDRDLLVLQTFMLHVLIAMKFTRPILNYLYRRYAAYRKRSRNNRIIGSETNIRNRSDGDEQQR